MSFPPSEVLAAHNEKFFMMRLADRVNLVLGSSGLTAAVSDAGMKSAVVISLPEGRNAVLGTYTRLPGCYLVWVAGHGPQRWPLDSDVDSVAHMFAAAARSHVASAGQLDSPYRWGRLHESTYTQLANELLDAGVDAGAISLPPFFVESLDGSLGGNRLSERVTITFRGGHARLCVTHDERYGWSVDLHSDGATGPDSGRLNARVALGAGDGYPPIKLSSDRIPELARVLARSSDWVSDPDVPWLEQFSTFPWNTDWKCHEDRELYVLELLAANGVLGDFDGWAEGRAWTDGKTMVAFDHSTSGANLAKVQRLFAGAAVEQLRLCLVCTTGGFTRTAVQWADKADSALFTLDATGHLRPWSAWASALTPIPSEPFSYDSQGRVQT